MPELEISAVIPAYNEEPGIASVIDGLRDVLQRVARKHEIIVVDDGSCDQTAELARQHGALTLRHPINRGYGRALVTGFNAARYDWVLMIDGDGSYPPPEIQKLVESADGFDMIVGARQGKLFWGNPIRSLMRWIYLSLAGFVAGESIPDANSGLRLIRKSEYFRCIPFLCLGYSFSTTLTLSFLQSGRFVAFVPVAYAERKGRSKVRPVRDILRTLQIMTQAIVYYNPLKLTVSAAALLSFASILCAAIFAAAGGEGLAVLLLATAAVLSTAILLAGCVLDSIRMHFQGRDNTLLSRDR